MDIDDLIKRLIDSKDIYGDADAETLKKISETLKGRLTADEKLASMCVITNGFRCAKAVMEMAQIMADIALDLGNKSLGIKQIGTESRLEKMEQCTKEIHAFLEMSSLAIETVFGKGRSKWEKSKKSMLPSEVQDIIRSIGKIADNLNKKNKGKSKE